jgi:hypothetical protein
MARRDICCGCARAALLALRRDSPKGRNSPEPVKTSNRRARTLHCWTDWSWGQSSALAAWPRGGPLAGPDPIVFQLGLVARPPAPRPSLATVLRASLTAFDRSPKPAQRSPKGLKPRRLASARLAARREGRSTSPKRSATASRSASDRSLRQRKHGDTVEAIAPDAAALRSRHVARRMDCGSSWVLLGLLPVAVVDVGRAQVAARCAGGPPRVMLPTSVSPSLARCFAAIAP